jgi:hypothetical protein
MTYRALGLWTLVIVVLVAAVASAALVVDTLLTRYQRDVSRIVFNDNVQFLFRVRRDVGAESDSLARALASSPGPGAEQPYIVVSIEDHRLWFRDGDSVLFTTEVATGSGRILERSGSDAHWRFETPRGRLTVVSKELDPVWVPPDWHYVEEAQRRGLGVVRLNRGERIRAGDGAWITVLGSDVVREFPDGRRVIAVAGEGSEIVAEGNVIVPPFGTNQRKYRGVLGTHRLNIGDGYALHGTNRPETVGRSVSHGCVRLRNEDIAALYDMVPTGTPVYIY